MLYGIFTHGEEGIPHAIDLILAALNQMFSQLHSSLPSTFSQHVIKPKI
tara:strand:- start:33 stop:179 length:147 start_codon:yes stop_codon:yes gene_type:complete